MLYFKGVNLLKKYLQNINKKTVIFTVLLFIAISALVYLFPYSGDDWAWGSEIGLNRLESNFENYNGRYGGNLLVLALTRSKLLNIIVIGISLVGVCLLPKLLSNSKRVLPYAFGTLLFLLIPRQIFVQSVVWTSGYSNYIPPILMTMLYFVIVKNIFEEDKPHYHWTSPIFVAVIGFVSALFMENVTLYNIAISALVILFVLIKFKKIYLTHIAHFIGSVAGAVLMFTNSAYGLIANETDSYRSTAFGEGLKKTIIDHTNIIYQQFFNNNLIVLAILSLLCVTVYILYAKSSINKQLKTIGALSVILNVFSFGIIFAKNRFSYWVFFIEHPESESISIILFALVAAMYFASVFLIVILCVTEKKAKFKTLLLLISVPVLIAPLVLVNPIGPRCFFPPYFMLISSCVMLLVYVQNEVKLSKTVSKGATVSLLAGCLAVFVFLFSVYSTIHKYDVKRNEYVQKQVEAGYDTVTVCRLPYTSHVWMGDPTSAPWDERYKYFHGIDQDINFEFEYYKGFNEWAEEFDKEVSDK